MKRTLAASSAAPPSCRARRRALTTLTFLLGGSLVAAPQAEQAEFFEKRIRPVLVENCYECHSSGKKVKGGLSLDDREAMLRGGDSGPSLVAGDPDKSKIIEAVRYKNHDLQMPPKKALSAAQISDLETWVKMGAPDPRLAKPAAEAKRTINIEQGRQFWSFAPLSNPRPPQVKDSAWPRSPVDAFILAELEKHGLHPAPPADRRTLIRRVTFDLVGLPPAPADVEAFVADPSPSAFDKVIERLLASPQYGERWGRHWLDVARYADTNGMDENVAYGQAWRYRDYVARAFNDNKPFDQFLIEQIAGDLLPAAAHTQPSREDVLAATGFLSLGGRVLAEPDTRKLEMDIIDEQLDTLGKTFLGMTFGCCRCHDHKFDPITTGDYYALAAIFRSTKVFDDAKGGLKFWYEHSLATPAQLEAKKKFEEGVKGQSAKVSAFRSATRDKLKSELQAHAAEYLAAAAALPAEADYATVAALAGQRHLRPRYLLTCRQYLERNPEHPFFAAWRASASRQNSGAVLDHYGDLFTKAAQALKEAKAKDAKATQVADPALAAALDALNDTAGFLTIPDKDADALDADMLAPVDHMLAELEVLKSKTPDPPTIMGVSDGPVVKTLPIHLRGSYLTLGPEVERGFPEVMRTSLAKPVLPAKQSGRLELARWMAGGDHPLTARVMVNRLWRWHFGRGIVGTPDNFGILGDKPSHPALLDWLARAFIENGWSIKDMHRLLLKSRVYQMASTHPAAGQPSSSPDPAMIDPDNKLLWRAPVQRLEAEEFRDALFAVSGSLDAHMGGKTIPLRNREYVFDHTSKDHTTYESQRRALYLPIIRNHLYDLLEQFDYPDPAVATGSRNATVVAPQALLMMNSPVAMGAADLLAAKLCATAASPEKRVQHAYALLYARPPGAHEVQRALTFLDRYSGSSQAWSRLCHTLMAANEFLYLR